MCTCSGKNKVIIVNICRIYINKMPVKRGGTGARARSLSRSSSATSSNSGRRANTGLAEGQRQPRERRAGRQLGEVKERDRLEKEVEDQTLRVHRFRGTLDITKSHISAFVSILEEGKVKVKTATREKEAATAKVRRQETARAAAKAVLEER